MSMGVPYVVEAVGSKPTKTRFGVKDRYSFKAGGVWFSTNFKDHKLAVGDMVQFNYEATKWGNEVDPDTIVHTGLTPVAVPATGEPTGTATVAPRPYTPAPTGSKGVFPIPPLDGQRSIVRQNALTNARELVLKVHTTEGSSEDNLKDLVEKVLKVARKFEAYTAGDLDREAAEKSVAAETKKAA